VLVKLAITAIGNTLDSDVDPRFGRARHFIIIDADGGIVEVVDNAATAELPHGAGIAAVETLVRWGVTTVVTGQVGPKAEHGLRAAGIEVRTGASGRCRDALAALAPELAAVVAATVPASGA
jgi:predicted Fe-Mo cluster-binding NifX family protein